VLVANQLTVQLYTQANKISHDGIRHSNIRNIKTSASFNKLEATAKEMLSDHIAVRAEASSRQQQPGSSNSLTRIHRKKLQMQWHA
jgi:hypothetical protein